MPTYGQISNGQIYLGASVGWQPIPTGTVGIPSPKPSTVKASTVKVSTAPVVQGNVVMPSASTLVAPAGSYTPLVVQPATAPTVAGVNAPQLPVGLSQTQVSQIQSGMGSAAFGATFPNVQMSASGQPLFSGFQTAVPAVITPPGTAPNVGGLFAPPPPPAPSPTQPATTPSRQASQVVSPYSGRSMASDAYRPAISAGVTQHLDYLDRLGTADPARAAEVARFQSATIGRANPDAALATNVFFTETAINSGQLPRTASLQVWDVIAARMGLGMTGEQLLLQRGYVPIGGGLYYLGALGGGSGVDLGAATPRNLGGGGDGGGGGGDGGFSRFLSNASAGLFNWRIGS